MLSQFSIGFASAAVLVCVWVGTLLRAEPRTRRMRFAKAALISSLAVSIIQTVSALPVLPAPWNGAVFALACAVSALPALAGFQFALCGARDARLRDARARWIAALPAALFAAACAAAFAWAAAGSALMLAASGVCLAYAVCGAALLTPALSGARTVFGTALWALCTAAGCAGCFAGAGLAALALGGACGVVLLTSFESSPSVSGAPGTRLYSRAAFLDAVRDFYADGRPFTCTAVVLPQLALAEESYPPERSGALLRELGAYLSRAARRSPVYRVSPAAFVVVDRGAERRERMMAEMETRFEQPWGAFGRMELRFVKLYAPDDCPDEASLLYALSELSARAARADSPMLLSCSEEIQTAAARRTDVAAALIPALETGAVEVAFRPVYTPRVHRVTAAQLCARLSAGGLGEITDAELRDAARGARAELRLEALLFEKMCSAVREARLTEAGVETFYVPLSPLQWKRRGLADELAGEAHRNGIEIERLVFELPEECLCGDAAECITNADRLTAFGAQVAVTGFGFGECGLERMLALDAKLIRLDGGFVRSYCRGETLTPDYLAPMFVARGKRLLADGVETKRHADAMTKLGCVGLQGDYYARPMDAAALAAFVTSATSAWEHFVREHAVPEKIEEETQAEP